MVLFTVIKLYNVHLLVYPINILFSMGLISYGLINVPGALTAADVILF